MSDSNFDTAWTLAREAEIQGMIAANLERTHRGEVPAYNEEAFQMKADELRGLAVFIEKYRMGR